jgi:hypothetical protein
MAKRQSTDKTRIDRTQVIVAIIGAIGVIVVGYWQFVWRPSQQLMVTTPASQQVEYVGHVLDINTGNPIEQAEVTLDYQGAPPIVYSDSHGIYRFTITIQGNQSQLDGRVRIRADDYENYDRNITLYVNNPNIEDIRLNPSN